MLFARIDVSREYLNLFGVLVPTPMYRVGVFEGDTPFSEEVVEKLKSLGMIDQRSNPDRKDVQPEFVSEPMAPTPNELGALVAEITSFLIDRQYMKSETIEVHLDKTDYMMIENDEVVGYYGLKELHLDDVLKYKAGYGESRIEATVSIAEEPGITGVMVKVIKIHFKGPSARAKEGEKILAGALELYH